VVRRKLNSVVEGGDCQFLENCYEWWYVLLGIVLSLTRSAGCDTIVLYLILMLATVMAAGLRSEVTGDA